MKNAIDLLKGSLSELQISEGGVAAAMPEGPALAAALAPIREAIEDYRAAVDVLLDETRRRADARAKGEARAAAKKAEPSPAAAATPTDPAAAAPSAPKRGRPRKVVPSPGAGETSPALPAATGLFAVEHTNGAGGASESAS